jgi:hypothetical protein
MSGVYPQEEEQPGALCILVTHEESQRCTIGHEHFF